MGAYLTWQPGPHTTDANRNCISNIRPEGIGYADAAFKLAYLIRAMRSRRISGVHLKDDSDRLLIGDRLVSVAPQKVMSSPLWVISGHLRAGSQ
jgi:ethanolamine ammonia-lyase small subunit